MSCFARCCGAKTEDDTQAPPVAREPAHAQRPSFVPMLVVSVAHQNTDLLTRFGGLELRANDCAARALPSWRPQLCSGFGFTHQGGRDCSSAAHDSTWTFGWWKDEPPIELPVALPRGRNCLCVRLACGDDGGGPPTERDVSFLCQMVIAATRYPPLAFDQPSASHLEPPLAACSFDTPSGLSELHACWVDRCVEDPSFNIVRRCWTCDPETLALVAHECPVPPAATVAAKWRNYYFGEGEEDE